MKAGEIVTFAHAPGETLISIKGRRHPGGPLEVHALEHFGTHSDPGYGKADAAVPVENGTAEYVVVCKVIAVVRRSARVEE